MSRKQRWLCMPCVLAGRRYAVGLGTGVALAMSVGCHGLSDLTGSQALPSGTADPSTYHTVAGATSLYRTAVAQFESGGFARDSGVSALQGSAFVGAVIATGLLTDELTADNLGCQPSMLGCTPNPLDARQLTPVLNPDAGGDYYTALQLVRNDATEALGALAAYNPNAPPAWSGQLYALQGYAEILLADLFCSGVPLSTFDFNGSFTYHAGSTTVQVYQDALSKFASALPLAADSARILNLARIGRGRAFLALGQYDSAAAMVAPVPDDYVYSFLVDWSSTSGQSTFEKFGVSQADHEGQNGLPYVSSNDPRTAAASPGTNAFGVAYQVPVKYGGAALGVHPITVASGIEAQLIEAEADLHANGTRWLTMLNALRTTRTGTAIPSDTLFDTLGVTDCANGCGYDPGNGLGGSTPEFGQPYPGGFPLPGGYSLVSADTILRADTMRAPNGGNIQQYCTGVSWYIPCYLGDSLIVQRYVRPASTQWDAGTGGVAGLAPLSDPGIGLSGTAATNARVDLLFRERAFWLFLTGQRQGDLRRLIRQYHRDPTTVYPTGAYPLGGAYGSAVTVPIPTAEASNPLYVGCLSGGA